MAKEKAKTKEELLMELTLLRQQLAMLEASDSQRQLAEELFHTLIMTSSIGIYILQEGKFKLVNPQLQKLTSYSEEELLTMDPWKLTFPDDKEAVRENALKMLRGERSAPYEHRYVTRYGEVKWVSQAVAPIQYRGKRAVLGNFMDISERKQAEEWFRALFLVSSSTIGIYIMQDRRFKLVNPYFQKLSGYSEEELLSMEDPLQIVPTEDRQTFREECIKILKGQRSSPYEHRWFTKSGEERWNAEIITPIQYAGRRAVMGTFIDTTERHLAEEALRAAHDELEKRVRERTAELARANEALRAGIAERTRAEHLFRTLVFSSPISIYIIQDSRFKLANHQFLKLMGCSEKEVLNMDPSIAIFPEDKSKLREEATKMLKGESSSPCEHRYLTKSSEVRWTAETFAPIQYEGKRAVLISSMDITERKRAEEALQRSEEYFHQIIENALYIIMVLNGDGTVRYVSPSSEGVLGYKPEALIGKHLLELVHPDYLPEGMSTLTIAAQNPGVTLSRELHLRHKDGSWRLFEAWGKNLLGNPAVMGIVVNARDITKRRMLEKGLRQSVEKLQKDLEKILSAVAKTVEMRDPYSAGHQERVAQLASAIAKEMGLSEEQVKGIHLAALVHDIGKINIAAEILTKPSLLTEIEFIMVKSHPQVGYDILKDMEFPFPVAPMVLQHHERMNGSGYPSGLSGRNILREARLLTVADVVEAMSSHRAYRPAPGLDRAMQEISRNKGTLYDAAVVEACLRLFVQKGFRWG